MFMDLVDVAHGYVEYFEPLLEAMSVNDWGKLSTNFAPLQTAPTLGRSSKRILPNLI